MASASRPWGSSVPRTDKDVKAWLSKREIDHIPLKSKVLEKQEENKREALIEMPLGTWMLELPEIKELKQECYGCDVQLTDFCKFGLKDPENNSTLQWPRRQGIPMDEGTTIETIRQCVPTGI